VTPPKAKIDWETTADEFPVALVIFDSAQEILFESRQCEELAGFSIAEKGGIEEWLSALCPEEQHRKEVLRSWQTHVWANQVTRTFSLQLKGKKLREIEFRSTLKEDGGISVVIEDVTDQIQAEANRQHSKQKFRALFSHTENGTVLADRTGRIIDANPAFIRLVEIPLQELRMSTLAGLLHPRDAEGLDLATKELVENEGQDTIQKTVFLRTRSGEKQISLRYCPVGNKEGSPPMAIYVFETNESQMVKQLTDRINIVSKKAAALLNAVPDLIFLINEDLTIADFAPPPTPWKELETPDSWRGAPVTEVWPVMGELLSRSQKQILHNGKTVRANVTRGRQDEGGTSSCEFSISASSGGDGQLLVIVRNQGESKTAPETASPETGASSAETPEAAEVPPAPLRNEAVQHSFRNQMQLVTSLFSLEPQGAAALDAFLRWQIRLRALAHAVPLGNDDQIGLVGMLRSLADEVCSLTNSGPARRAVVISGAPRLKALACDASLLGLAAGELMRLVLGTRQGGRGPEITFELDRNETGLLEMRIRAGEKRRFLSTDEDSEVETLEILASQMRGQIQMVAGSDPGEWNLTAPILIS
jgi:PAS domain S-box-containing protein